MFASRLKYKDPELVASHTAYYHVVPSSSFANHLPASESALRSFLYVPFNRYIPVVDDADHDAWDLPGTM